MILVPPAHAQTCAEPKAADFKVTPLVETGLKNPVHLAVAPDGTVGKFAVPMRFVTNIAISGTRAAIVGPSINDRPPFPGRVEVLPRQTLLDLVKRAAPAVR